MPVQVIAGLGNPGLAYRDTRHNVGFLVVEALAPQGTTSWRRETRFEAECATLNRGGHSLLLVKPQTFMNESGRCLGALLRFHKLPPSSLLVVSDEFQLPLGTLKISTRGSSGGHHGLESVLREVGDGFVRLRVGIAPAERPPHTLTDFVLGRFLPEERAALDAQLDRCLAAVLLVVDTSPAVAMNQFNQRLKSNDRNPPQV